MRKVTVKKRSKKSIKSSVFRVRLFLRFRGPGVGLLAGNDRIVESRKEGPRGPSFLALGTPLYGFSRDFPLIGVVPIIPIFSVPGAVRTE